MGTFEVAVRVGHMLYGDMVDVTALVDTGATHTVLPASFLSELRVEPDMRLRIAYANGDVEEADSGQARIAYDNVERVCPVIFGAAGVYSVGGNHLGKPKPDDGPSESSPGARPAYSRPALLATLCPGLALGQEFEAVAVGVFEVEATASAVGIDFHVVLGAGATPVG